MTKKSIALIKAAKKMIERLVQHAEYLRDKNDQTQYSEFMKSFDAEMKELEKHYED